MQFQEILDRLDVHGPEGSGYLCHCPAHGDNNASLIVTLRKDGRLIMFDRGQGCSEKEVAAAIGLTTDDFKGVEAGDLNVETSIGIKAPPSLEQINWLRSFIDESHNNYEHAAQYALDRWGITNEMAHTLKLGFTGTDVAGEFIPYPWRQVPRIVVPLYGFDGVPRGAQGRALEEHDVRWCSLKTPPDNAWSRFGVLMHNHGDNFIQVGEGPGDALTAYASGINALFVRGTSMAAGVLT